MSEIKTNTLIFERIPNIIGPLFCPKSNLCTLGSLIKYKCITLMATWCWSWTFRLVITGCMNNWISGSDGAAWSMQLRQFLLASAHPWTETTTSTWCCPSRSRRSINYDQSATTDLPLCWMSRCARSCCWGNSATTPSATQWMQPRSRRWVSTQLWFSFVPTPCP